MEHWIQRWEQVTSRFEQLTTETMSGATVEALVTDSKELASWYREGLNAVT